MKANIVTKQTLAETVEQTKIIADMKECLHEAVAYYFNAGDENTGPAIRARAVLARIQRFEASRMKGGNV